MRSCLCRGRGRTEEMQNANAFCIRIHFFLPAFFTFSRSRKSFPALKRTFFDAGIAIFSFVRGLRPSRALRLETAKLPRPGIEHRSPRSQESEMYFTNASNAA